VMFGRRRERSLRRFLCAKGQSLDGSPDKQNKGGQGEREASAVKPK